MNAVRKLMPAATGWRIDSVPGPDPAQREISLIVSSVLLAPGTPDGAFFVGHDARSPANRYAGWGRPADKACSPEADLLPLNGESPEIGALLVPTCAMAAAVHRVLPSRRAAVLGQGLLAALVEEILRSQDVQIESAQSGAALPLIVDTSGEPSVWSSALDALCAEGTILLLVPPAPAPADFNFYPYVHRHSLRVIACHWHRLPPPSEQMERDSLVQMISNVLQKGRWLRSLDLGSSPADAEGWRSFDWQTCEPTGRPGPASDG